MSQQPPTGPAGAPGSSDDDEYGTPATPDEAGGEATETFGRSPYDTPETQPVDGTTAFPAASYGQAPDPGRTIYSEASTTEPEPEPGPEDGRPRWVVPVVVAVILLLVAGGVAAALLLGGDDAEDPVVPATATPTAEQTTEDEPTTEPVPTEEPTETAAPGATDAPTAGEPTEEPTPELLGDLDESVSVGDLTFELSEDGFTAEDGITGAVEAWRGEYVSGDESIDMLATSWPDNEAADEYAAELVEGIDGEQVETGDTYTNETGTFWAFLLEDGRGTYIWTTDRGHVLRVIGSTDHVGSFYSSYPL